MKKTITLMMLTHLLVFYLGYDAYRYGIENNNKIFPITKFVKRNLFGDAQTSPTQNQRIVGVYSDLSNKTQINCPQPKDAYVIVGFGQSNSANSAGHRFESKKDIVNFYNGKCYVASDPLLGATGRSGSVWIPFSERLNLKDKTIVLSTFGVGGTKVSDWLNDDYLMPFYKENIDSLSKVYDKPNAVVWIQGESDVSTPNELYSEQLKDWFEILKTDFSHSNIYVTGTSYCGNKSNESVLVEQRKQAENIDAVYVGSTDKLIQQSYRYDDCHFSEKGAKALASLIAESWIK